MVLERAQVEHVARLARLRLSPSEIEALGRQLGDILSFVARLEALPPAAPGEDAVCEAGCPLREDEPREGLGTEQALSLAPERCGDELVVPRVL